MPALLSRGAATDPGGGVVSVVTTTSYAGFVGSPLIVAGLTAWMTLPSAMACLGLLALPLLVVAVALRFPPVDATGATSPAGAPQAAEVTRRGPAAPG